MEFLATPHLWEIYETSQRQVQWSFAEHRMLVRSFQVAGNMAGAIALLIVSPDLQADVYRDAGRLDAGRAYIAPPPGYNVNIRSGPGTRFPAVNTLRAGTPIAVTGFYEDGWAQLTDRSWVAGNLIASSVVNISQGGPAIAYIDPPPGYNVNIRSGPGVEYAAVNTLAPGTAITITGRYENGWAQLADGSWVAGNLISIGRPIDRPITSPPGRDEFLTVGTRSPAVVPLEARLRELNYLPRDFVPDEYYGTETAQAVRNFQRRHQLTVDGIAGPQTQRVLYSSAAIANETPAESRDLQFGTRDPAVLSLEVRLQELNYLPATFVADTYYGRDTEDAIRNFQQRNNLAVTGIADSLTRDRLYSSTAVPNPSPTAPPTTTPGEPNFPTEPEVPTDPGTMREATVSTNDGLDALAFSGPGTEYDLLGFIPNGTEVTVTGRTQGNWSELEDGSWIYTDFLEF